MYDVKAGDSQKSQNGPFQKLFLAAILAFASLESSFYSPFGPFLGNPRSMSHVSFCTRDLVSRGEYKDMLLLTTVISIRCKISFLEFPSLEFEILPLDQTEQLLKAINHDFK